MTLTVFLAVILAAALHASWNAMVKGAADKDLTMAAVVIGHAPFALIAMAISPMPALESWGWIALSTVLHLGYQLFLLRSYRTGDLTQVYPIARGAAPLIVALVSVAALGETLSLGQQIGVMLIGCGVASVAIGGKASPDRISAVYALITACFIASYSLSDGIGARAAGTALGYYGWLGFLNAMVFVVFTALTRRHLLGQLVGPRRGLLLIGGGASFVAYAIVTWAFTQAPIALVTALRETSILFALAIGVLILNEKLNIRRVISAFVTLAGAILLRVSRG
ncbi:DMT family transporter [Pontivivens insulae]|uniref:EamA domain-containing protein n=1 Tax=Pontivivens insulae TaxID=1639689 RepID=A0A2R8ACC8_9RHOB|nr:DMT family transporter [Pontivivens insulae]RED13800.1 EamA-like transporter family protein [Pontivivens insulae]SPF29874.1 hypothetical protein POI8812_02195 [Pontivivens insulae]